MPQPVIDFLLDRAIYIKPSSDTAKPREAAGQYCERAAANHQEVEGATVCVVGYGGSVGIGIALLERGAARVILQDPFAPVRKAHDSAFAKLPAEVERVHRPLGEIAAERGRFADLVVSNSVLEHVADLDEVASACAAITRPDGLNIHHVDLRDHYFRYPFEMLCYSEATWRRWLNASNNLNRLRLPEYRRVFDSHFGEVDIEVLEHLREPFRSARPRIRREFLTGDEDIDAAAIVRIEARVRRSRDV